MAVNQRRRQKALEKKKSKRKAIKAARPSLSKTLSISRDIALAAGAPVHECLIPETLFELGIGNIIIAKTMANRHIGMGVFLLDIYCLGIKNALYANLSSVEYEEQKRQIGMEHALDIIHPSCARKLIEGGVAFAETYGFKPHRDYKVVRQIYSQIDPEVCPKAFEYGKEGKPFYVSGPHDTPPQIKSILNTLEKKCGPGRYDYILSENY